MEDYKNIDADKTGKFIKELRRKHNLKQDELGEKLFISRKSISKWETGRACPSVDMMKRMSKVFGITVDDLVAGEVISEPPNEEIERKSFDIKNYKIAGIVLLIIVSVLIVSMYFSNHMFSPAYKIYYEDENFFINDGLLVLDEEESYLSFGSTSTYIDSVDISKMKCILYVKNDDEIKELQVINLNKNNSLVDGTPSEIRKHIVGNEIKDVFIKIFYFNDMEEEVSFHLELIIRRKAKAPKTASRAVVNEMDKSYMIESYSDEASETAYKIPDTFDVGFLFNMSKDKLKSCSNYAIDVNGLEYKVIYNEIDNLLNLESPNDLIVIHLDSRRFMFCFPYQSHFSITEDNVIKYGGISNYYNTLFILLNDLKERCHGY